MVRWRKPSSTEGTRGGEHERSFFFFWGGGRGVLSPFFHALTIVGSRGSCVNTRPLLGSVYINIVRAQVFLPVEPGPPPPSPPPPPPPPPPPRTKVPGSAHVLPLLSFILYLYILHIWYEFINSTINLSVNLGSVVRGRIASGAYKKYLEN